MARPVARRRPEGAAARYLAHRQDERDSAALYEALSELEAQPPLREVYRRGRRTGALIWLARRFGSALILPAVTNAEVSDSRAYRTQAETQGTPLPAQEGSHARILRTIAREIPGGLEGSALARLEGRHRAASGNALRAAVLGASDGLLSNFSLVMGVAGASPEGRAVLVAGLAGLLAGAFSMALGEWISVRSSRELFERQLAVEREELEGAPEEEAEELALIYEAKGVRREEARALAERLMADKETALDTLAREELGIDPAELGGSAWEAALTSFALFAVGAVFPVLPFLFGSGLSAVLASVLLSAARLFGIGAAITLLTGKGVLYSGGRQRPSPSGWAASSASRWAVEGLGSRRAADRRGPTLPTRAPTAGFCVAHPQEAVA